MQPLVSILIPAYNSEQWITPCIESALRQTWQPKEIIVVDDGSTDTTLQVVQRFASRGVRVLTQPNQGASVARNTAFAASQGDYIQWLDADDLLEPDKIERQMEQLKHCRSKMTLLSGAWGKFYYRKSKAHFDPTTLWCDLTPLEWMMRKMGQNLHMQTDNWLISRELSNAAGPWDKRLFRDNDGEYLCRVILASDGIKFVPAARSYYRFSGFGSISYIGKSARKIESYHLSMQLHMNYLRSLEDSERTRNVCLQDIRTNIHQFYPHRPDLVDKLRATTVELGGEFVEPTLSWKYDWLRRSFGWGVARQAQIRVPQLKTVARMAWDKAMFGVEARLARETDPPVRAATLSLPAGPWRDRLPTAHEDGDVRAFDEHGAFLGDVRHDGGNLRTLVVKSAGITTLSQGAKVVIQIASTIVLARLLSPAEFGLMTMVTTFSLLFVNFGISGFTEAVIQRETMDHGLASNLFWANMGFIVALTLIFAAGGPLMAWFYKDPRVTGVAAATALTIFFSGLSVLHLALLRRAMQFTAISVNEIAAQASSVLTSVVLAILGWGYWALVAGAVALPLVTAVGAWIQCRWIPGLPRRRVETMPMVRFALNIYGYFTVNYFGRNVDNLLVGSFFGPQALGAYKKAFDLAIFPIVQAAGPLNSVAVPTLSRLKDDPDKYCRYILRSLGVLALLGMGAGGCLTLIGKDLIRLLLGPKWGESGRIFMYFAPGIGAMFVYRIAGWLHLSMGTANKFFRWGMIEFAVLGSMFVMALPWGPVGIGLVWGLSCWLLTIPAILYAPRPAQLTLTSMLAVMWPYAGGSAIGGVACAALLSRLPLVPTGFGPIDLMVRMAVTSALFGVIYLAATAVLHRGWTPLLEIGSLVRDMAPWRKLAPARPAVADPARPA